MEDKSLMERIGEEMEKDGLDLLEQVIVLIMGGVLGGQALQVAQAGRSIWYEFGAYAIIFFVGIVTLGFTHLFVSYHRAIDE
ncbi:hypothetical protein [Halorientalis halophila]|uniref:hypothetical protein n=1 Tax=Halorientalis halophila TaxID=3108499 RepID=UPI0030097730